MPKLQSIRSQSPARNTKNRSQICSPVLKSPWQAFSVEIVMATIDSMNLGASAFWSDLGKIALTYILALPIGWQREKEAHSVGVRTFPLVAMASCAFVLLGTPAGTLNYENQSRIIQGLVAGIGFIGGGAILKAQGNVHGTATAASIWTTGVIGAAVAEDRFFMA